VKFVEGSDYSNESTRISAGRHKTKWFTDVLNPLERFLHKNVNRPWDKVYAEVCTGLDRRSVSGNHVFQHLYDFVEVNCFLDEAGHPVAVKWGELRPVEGLYVHPKTKLLRAAPKQRWRSRWFYEGSRNKIRATCSRSMQ
jgi:hypothetical protein